MPARSLVFPWMPARSLVYFHAVVRIFIMVARCSKCDFRNLGIIWDRNRWSEKKLSENFSSKKIRKLLVENFLGPKIFDFCRKKKIVEKINENSKFWNFENFRKFFEISKNWFSLTFSTKNFFGQKSKIFGPKNFRPKVFGFFSTKKFPDKKFRITYFDPKWSQDSENHT